MRDKLLVILGRQRRQPGLKVVKPAKRKHAEPDLDILNKSPCLQCGLFVENTACPYVKRCGKIDEFQRLAAACRTLCKPYDVYSLPNI
ncbi:MAG: hypothetical protein HWN68_17420 [Desulfobacterales bacterium]|nr:hypothetical protein [Desulfobacterales bacterium]